MKTSTQGQQAPTLREALRIFLGCAYPCSTEIDERGHRWVEAYLDQAREIALAALAQPIDTASPSPVSLPAAWVRLRHWIEYGNGEWSKEKLREHLDVIQGALATPQPSPTGPVEAQEQPAGDGRPDIIERLSYHAHERDDMTLDDCLDYLANGWKFQMGRTPRQMVMQILSLHATRPQASAPPREGEPEHCGKAVCKVCDDQRAPETASPSLPPGSENGRQSVTGNNPDGDKTHERRPENRDQCPCEEKRGGDSTARGDAIRTSGSELGARGGDDPQHEVGMAATVASAAVAPSLPLQEPVAEYGSRGLDWIVGAPIPPVGTKLYAAPSLPKAIIEKIARGWLGRTPTDAEMSYALRALAAPSLPAALWIVVQEHVIEFEDGGRPALGYLLPAEFPPFATYDEAMAFRKEKPELPLGWVVKELRATLKVPVQEGPK